MLVFPDPHCKGSVCNSSQPLAWFNWLITVTMRRTFTTFCCWPLGCLMIIVKDVYCTCVRQRRSFSREKKKKGCVNQWTYGTTGCSTRRKKDRHRELRREWLSSHASLHTSLTMHSRSVSGAKNCRTHSILDMNFMLRFVGVLPQVNWRECVLLHHCDTLC